MDDAPALDRFSLFATPVLVFQLGGADALNEELRARLAAEAATLPGALRSNVGGWHSAPDLDARPEPCWRALMQAIVEHVGVTLELVAADAGLAPPPAYRYGLQAWAMVMRDGDYTILHDHGDAHWSTVYYVDTGDADEARHPQSGLLSFVDARSGGRPLPLPGLFPSTFNVRPRPGMLVVFPGWLPHYVHPYRGTRPRISVSCNLVMGATIDEAGAPSR